MIGMETNLWDTPIARTIGQLQDQELDNWIDGFSPSGQLALIRDNDAQVTLVAATLGTDLGITLGPIDTTTVAFPRKDGILDVPIPA